MVGSYDPDRHHRRSIRLVGYDYRQNGCYFVTICAAGRACLFGEIVDDEMVCSPLGDQVRAGWLEIPRHFPGVELDVFVIMPNHFHGILVLPGKDEPCLEVAVDLPRGPQKQSLGAIVGSFKAAVSRQSRHLRESPEMALWQRNYYERILRDEKSLDRAREYIAANPARWVEDSEYRANP
jgi:putative transposase